MDWLTFKFVDDGFVQDSNYIRLNIPNFHSLEFKHWILVDIFELLFIYFKLLTNREFSMLLDRIYLQQKVNVSDSTTIHILMYLQHFISCQTIESVHLHVDKNSAAFYLRIIGIMYFHLALLDNSILQSLNNKEI